MKTNKYKILFMLLIELFSFIYFNSCLRIRGVLYHNGTVLFLKKGEDLVIKGEDNCEIAKLYLNGVEIKKPYIISIKQLRKENNVWIEAFCRDPDPFMPADAYVVHEYKILIRNKEKIEIIY